MTPMRIGFVGFGEVASVFSRTVLKHGAEILAYNIEEGKVDAGHLKVRQKNSWVDSGSGSLPSEW
jgi:3-hydroxyisobutyrate dehydrogenase-like beta-hydroxyacid dehydrogenase